VWTLSNTLEVSYVADTINKAKAASILNLSLTIHSNRSSLYVSKAYKDAAAKMVRNYAKKVFPWDNAYMKSFHLLIKREWLKLFTGS